MVDFIKLDYHLEDLDRKSLRRRNAEICAIYSTRGVMI